ncbi:Glycine betaine transporter BetP [Sphingobacterium mizutaii]|uniref:Glycine betaine transporter BetP n=2 Tax=Sphingobacterium mizutaii TaxID=1010 RepID=A0AAJ4XAK0_9SPHI|nr:BCCT family transporter [Sphingobacterium mizutaii]SDK96592.1 choline/glycine/proline betaine transport protein [Sphingobacterium mizutaii]SNV49055.1 Glycine betaine transporter BetP [Sphingobacterium mizutaii]
MSKTKNFRSSLSMGVTIPSLIFIVGVCLASAIFPEAVNKILNDIKAFIFVNLNWVYVWSVTIFVLFLLFLMVSKFGDIKLGRNDSSPDYSFFSWISMLFAAGMGIGLMYFSVSEPMQHYTNEIFAKKSYVNAAKNAQLYTFFHWGIHAWAIYGLVGLALSYFAYRYKLPLSLRSCLYPLLKDRIQGNWGNAIDVFALCSTFFGITTTLGFGVVQVNSGLEILGIVPSTDFINQVFIVVILVSISVFSATTGVDKGVRILSNINIGVVILLMVFVLFLGPTVYLIGSFTEGIGNYINNFFSLTFNTHVYEEESLPWFYDWTILYWAWWISWSPFVGLFIAKISKGRTIREFIAAVLILPSIFNFMWMSVFGNSAIWLDSHVAEGALSALATDPDSLMFRFLEYLPLTKLISFMVIGIIMIFFVTSADSGMFVMNSIATKNAKISPKRQIAGWGGLLAVLALFLLNAGGLEALQSMTLITALPFSLIILMMIVCLVKALSIDKKYYEQEFSVSTVPWSGKFWKERLKQIVNADARSDVDEFINQIAAEAIHELQQEFMKNGVEAKVTQGSEPKFVEIEIQYDLVNNFLYGIRRESREVPEYFQSEENLTDSGEGEAYFPLAYFGDARQGYDVRFFTREELIADILKHYERFVAIISEGKNEMFISSNANRRIR